MCTEPAKDERMLVYTQTPPDGTNAAAGWIRDETTETHANTAAAARTALAAAAVAVAVAARINASM